MATGSVVVAAAGEGAVEVEAAGVGEEGGTGVTMKTVVSAIFVYLITSTARNFTRVKLWKTY